jgi:hypothetical protein
MVDGEAKVVLELCVWYGDLMRAGARLLAELFVTLLVIDAACEFLLTYN